MKCELVRSRLAEYHLGGLGFVSRERIRRHLARCSACAKELAGLASLDETIGDALRGEEGPDLWPRVVPLLEAEHTKPKRMRYAWALVGAASVLAILTLIWQRGPQVRQHAVAAEHYEVGYERQHALLGWNDPLADRAQLGLVGEEE